MAIDSSNNYVRKLTNAYYFKSTVVGLILFVEVEHIFRDKDEKSDTTNVSKRREFVKATLSDAFALNLAHS